MYSVHTSYSPEYITPSYKLITSKKFLLPVFQKLLSNLLSKRLQTAMNYGKMCILHLFHYGEFETFFPPMSNKVGT